MTGLPTKNKFALAGNPNIAPPSGPVALGSALDENFSNCAPLINLDNYPTNSALAINLASVAILNGAASSADQVVAGVGLVGGGSIGSNPTIAAGSELAGVAGLGTSNLTGLVNRTGPGAYNAITLEAGTGITITPEGNTLTIASTGETVAAVVQTIMGGTDGASQLAGTFPTAPTAGNYLIALWSSYTGSYEYNTSYWTLLTSQGEAADNLIVTYHLVASGDSSSIIIATLPASTGIYACFEVSGLTAPPTIDVSSLSQTNSTTSHTASAGPTTATDLALVLSYSTSTGVALSADSAWTVDQTVVNATGRDGWAGHKLYPNAGATVSETTTFGTSTTNEVILVALKYVGGGIGSSAYYTAGSGPPTGYEPAGTIYVDEVSGYAYISDPLFTPGTSAPTIVQSAIGHAGPKTSTAVPLTVTLPAAPTAGNLLVAVVAVGASPYASYTATGWTVAQGTNSTPVSLVVLYKYVLAGDTAVQTLQTDVTSTDVAFAYIWELNGANPVWSSGAQYIYSPAVAEIYANSLPQPSGVTTTGVNSLGLSFSTTYNVSGTAYAAVPDSSWTTDYDLFSVIAGNSTSNIAAHKIWATSGGTVSNNISLPGTFETFHYGFAIVVLNCYGGGTYTPYWQKIAPFTVNSQSGTSYTLGATDAHGLVSMTNGSANTVTVPPNSAVPLAVGTAIAVEQAGAGKTTIAAGSGVTVNYMSTLTASIVGQYGVAQLVKKATNTWTLFGAIGG